MEMFDIIDSSGKELNFQKERSAVHTDGDWHKSVHIWIIKNNKVLLQKRKDDKDSFPSCYDIASAGHVDAGEDFVNSAIRELEEELSVKANKEDFQFLFYQKLCVSQNFCGKKFVSNEINAVYLLDENVSLEKLDFQKSEISALKWEDIDELKSHLNESNYCIKSDEFNKVLSFINK